MKKLTDEAIQTIQLRVASSPSLTINGLLFSLRRPSLY